jgi:hypothetical protein
MLGHDLLDSIPWYTMVLSLAATLALMLSVLYDAAG